MEVYGVTSWGYVNKHAPSSVPRPLKSRACQMKMAAPSSVEPRLPSVFSFRNDEVVTIPATIRVRE